MYLRKQMFRILGSAIAMLSLANLSHATVVKSFAVEEPSTFPWSTVLWIVAACLVVLIVISVCILRKPKAVPQNNPSGIYMALEVLEGLCKTKEAGVFLQDAIYIGTTKTCQSRWKSSEMAPLSGKIFMGDGLIYLESLDPSIAIYVDGMRIQQYNRLRSGNTITIGQAQFCLKF